MHSPVTPAPVGHPSDSAREAAPGAERASFVTRGFWPGFLLVTSMFFAWALANNLNDILIRQFQKALALSRGEAGLIQFAFYFAYFLWALPAGLLLRRLGYRAGLLIGLALYAVGALLFVPAAAIREYWAFLMALFVLASGAAFLETSANPYIVRFGDPARAPQRLNFAQAFNGLGAVIAPVLGGMFIFSGVEHSDAQLQAMSAAQLDAYRASEVAMVEMPYAVLAGFVLLLALAIARVRLPRIDDGPRIEDGGSAPSGSFRAVLGNRLLLSAVAAQFFYVGAQVGIWSFFVDFVKHLSPATPEKTAAYLLSASLLTFMIGRFIGTALMARIAPVRLLLVFALVNIALVALAMSLSGMAAVAALGATCFFMSIMFPTIFALGLENLGDGVPLGSSLLIMAIIGGAVFPPVMGLVSEAADLQAAMALPMACFAVVALFAWRVK